MLGVSSGTLASGLHEPPDHPEAGRRALAKRDERHHGETGSDQRYERAELGLQRGEIGVEALSLGGDLARISSVPRCSDMALHRLDRTRCLLERLLRLRGRGLACEALRQEPGDRRGEDEHPRDDE